MSTKLSSLVLASRLMFNCFIFIGLDDSKKKKNACMTQKKMSAGKSFLLLFFLSLSLHFVLMGFLTPSAVLQHPEIQSKCSVCPCRRYRMTAKFSGHLQNKIT